jgi:mannose-6-phosphate isomerase-like protein (cupin superfamily)
MDELQKGLALSVRGRLRDEALAKFEEQIAEWHVALPPVEPLVLDFGLSDFYRIGLIEYWIVNEMDAGYCGKYLFVFDGQTCPTHHHRQKKESFFLVKGRLKVELGSREIELKPGDVLPVEPGRPHSFTGIGPALLLELSKPCVIDDNFFADESIPIGGNHRPRPDTTSESGPRRTN